MILVLDRNRATSCTLARRKTKKMGEGAGVAGPVYLVNEEKI